MVSWRVLEGGEVGAAGPWAYVTAGYMALRFDIDGQTHFGWARISTDYGSTWVVLHDWAYETRPGEAIRAGDRE